MLVFLEVEDKVNHISKKLLRGLGWWPQALGYGIQASTFETASPRSGECSPYVLAAWLPYRHLGYMVQVTKSFRQKTRSWSHAQLRHARETRYHMIACKHF